jgi:predicted nucleic acid-binding protein
MSRVFWDTNLYIYLLEDYGELSALTVDLRARMLRRGDQLITSAFTLGEILVKPSERGETAICRKYEHGIVATSLVIPFDVEAARNYAMIRRDRSIRAPDAIQLACAAAARVDLFVTNDNRLQTKQAAGIQFVVSLDRVPI